jgi:adenylate cyclase
MCLGEALTYVAGRDGEQRGAGNGMHVLARGDLLQRLRLASGLILLVFAATHFLNHALGLVSIEAMEAMQGWRKAVTRSWLG